MAETKKRGGARRAVPGKRALLPATAVNAASFGAALIGLGLTGEAFAQTQTQRPRPTPPPVAPPTVPGSLLVPGSGTTSEQPSSPLEGALPSPGLDPNAKPVTTPAADVPPAQRISGIDVRGGRTVTSETVAYYLGIRVGEKYEPAVLRKNFQRLWDSGLFEDLRLEREDDPKGGNLVVAHVVERPKVSDLEFRGNKKLTQSQLKDKLKEGKVEIKVGGPISLRDVAKAKSVLIEAYKAEGYRSAVLDAKIEESVPNERRVVFDIDEGDKIKIDQIKFTGNNVFSQGRLRRTMKKTKKAVWYMFWETKNVYNQANYDEDVESVKRLYQDYGYKDVVVKDPVIETFVTNPREARPDKVKRRARITIPVVEGDQFMFGSLKVEGSTLFDNKRLEKAFDLYKPGKPLSRAVLAEGTKSIETLYRERGYIYAFMNPEYEEKANKVVDVTVRVTEGDQFRLGRVEFTGNKTTREKVLRRELLLAEGDILDMERFRKGLFKITQLGYFKIEEDPDFKVQPDSKTVDVTVKGIDTNRNEVQFGAGYSQLDGLFGQFQFSTRNFLGRGDTIGVQFQRGNRSNFFDLSFGQPYFLDQRMAIGGSIFNRSQNYLDVDQRARGVNFSYGLSLGVFDSVSAFYGYTDTKSRYEVFPPPPPPGGPAPPIAFADFRGKTSAITPGYRYDSRNDPFDPSRGKRLGLSVTVAGGALGGDFSYVKPAGNATFYVPTGRKTTAALNLEFGFVRPYGQQEIPIFERFRIGGDRSVRGFQYGAIFPIDDQDRAFFNEQGALLGGDRFLVVNFEYVYVIAGPLKLAAFLDAGNAWIETQKFRPWKLRASTGLELRVFLPIFQAPLRFIYGYNLDPKIIKDQDGLPLRNGEEKKTDFQFSIGTTF
ncbi:MAG: outer membrane protein assembly factor BamA [Acidobacteria bacterium]|nr:outer membrane protein assembly factor BamA [Acidobacteriota bacterium]